MMALDEDSPPPTFAVPASLSEETSDAPIKQRKIFGISIALNPQSQRYTIPRVHLQYYKSVQPP